MRIFLMTAMVIAMIGLTACSADKLSEDKQHYVDQAVKSGVYWLQLVDAGKYDSSWVEASPIFKAAVTQKRWSGQMQAIRRPMGSVKSRKVKSTQYRTEMPGAPDGDYVIIQFDTEFEHKKSAVETLTPAKNAQSEWRISGYYIK